MGNSTTELLLAWGCPDEYAREWGWSGNEDDCRRVSACANWYSEHDRALGEMVRREERLRCPPIGWGMSMPAYADRQTRWQARPEMDRLGDPRRRDTTEAEVRKELNRKEAIT